MNDFEKDKEKTNLPLTSEVSGSTALFGGSYGWICPKCGRVYSPFTMMCPYCKDNNEVIYTNN